MSYGDDIMTTGTARKMKARFPNHKVLIGDGWREYRSPIFINNPNIDTLNSVRTSDQVVWIHDYWGNRPYLNNSLTTMDRNVFVPFKPVKGDLYFTASEIQAAKKAIKALDSFVVIEPNIKSTYCTKNKDWGFDKWQRVVDQLRQKTTFVQLGDKKARTLKGVTRIITDNFRAACAILSFAKLLAGPEGGLHHAAAALDIPAVVIFGGRISPKTTGYKIHINLYVDLPGSPCGMVAECKHCKRCLANISVKQVTEAIDEKL